MKCFLKFRLRRFAQGRCSSRPSYLYYATDPNNAFQDGFLAGTLALHAVLAFGGFAANCPIIVSFAFELYHPVDRCMYVCVLVCMCVFRGRSEWYTHLDTAET